MAYALPMSTSVCVYDAFSIFHHPLFVSTICLVDDLVQYELVPPIESKYQWQLLLDSQTQLVVLFESTSTSNTSFFTSFFTSFIPSTSTTMYMEWWRQATIEAAALFPHIHFARIDVTTAHGLMIAETYKAQQVPRVIVFDAAGGQVSDKASANTLNQQRIQQQHNNNHTKDDQLEPLYDPMKPETVFRAMETFIEQATKTQSIRNKAKTQKQSKKQQEEVEKQIAWKIEKHMEYETATRETTKRKEDAQRRGEHWAPIGIGILILIWAIMCG